ncbi:MAG: OsmC family protein [Bacteroidetes bacterium]|nr:OsmC family protein [Bacteroidota bacterium]
MSHKIETQWMGKMQFNTLINGHTVVMDGPERAGGEDRGPIPKPFMLSALSGCTGMDVVALLRKAEKPVDDLNIVVSGEISKRAPIEYTAIHVVYDFKGPEENKQAAFTAVTDSQEKYCGVSHMLKKILPVTWEINYNSVQIFNNKKESVAL